jgi:MFS family permease
MALTSRLIFSGQGGVAESGGMMLAGMLPLLLASPLAGKAADRFDRRWLMILSELVSGLAVLGLLFTGRLPIIYGLLALQAFASGFMTPARISALTAMVPAQDLSQTNAFLNQLSSLMKVLAPTLGGAIVAVVGARSAMAIDLVSYLISAALLSTLHPLRAVAPEKDEAGRQGGSALRLIWHNPGLRILTLSSFFGVCFIASLDLLIAVYVKNVLGSGTGLFGIIVSLIGAGAVLTGWWLMFRKEGRPWRDYSLGQLLLALLIGGMALGAWLPTALAIPIILVVSLVGGVGNGLLMIQGPTLLQLLTPASHLGRVAGITEAITTAARVVTMLAVPLFVPQVLSIRLHLLLCTFGLLLITLLVARRASRVSADQPAAA